MANNSSQSLGKNRLQTPIRATQSFGLRASASNSPTSSPALDKSTSGSSSGLRSISRYTPPSPVPLPGGLIKRNNSCDFTAAYLHGEIPKNRSSSAASVTLSQYGVPTMKPVRSQRFDQGSWSPAGGETPSPASCSSLSASPSDNTQLTLSYMLDKATQISRRQQQSSAPPHFSRGTPSPPVSAIYYQQSSPPPIVPFGAFDSASLPVSIPTPRSANRSASPMVVSDERNSTCVDASFEESSQELEKLDLPKSLVKTRCLAQTPDGRRAPLKELLTKSAAESQAVAAAVGGYTAVFQDLPQPQPTVHLPNGLSVRTVNGISSNLFVPAPVRSLSASPVPPHIVDQPDGVATIVTPRPAPAAAPPPRRPVLRPINRPTAPIAEKLASEADDDDDEDDEDDGAVKRPGGGGSFHKSLPSPKPMMEFAPSRPVRVMAVPGGHIRHTLLVSEKPDLSVDAEMCELSLSDRPMVSLKRGLPDGAEQTDAAVEQPRTKEPATSPNHVVSAAACPTRRHHGRPRTTASAKFKQSRWSAFEAPPLASAYQNGISGSTSFTGSAGSAFTSVAPSACTQPPPSFTFPVRAPSDSPPIALQALTIQ